jgi:hypothetical protein
MRFHGFQGEQTFLAVSIVIGLGRARHQGVAWDAHPAGKRREGRDTFQENEL